MPALPPYIIEPIWEQFCALLPEGRRTTRSVAIVPASPIGWSSRSSSRSWCSAAPTGGSPTRGARLPPSGADATSGSRRE